MYHYNVIRSRGKWYVAEESVNILIDAITDALNSDIEDAKPILDEGLHEYYESIGDN